MDDDAAPENIIQAETFHLPDPAGFTLSVGHQIRYIAAVVVVAVMMTMLLPRRIEMSLGTARISGAAIADIMDVKTMLTGA